MPSFPLIAAPSPLPIYPERPALHGPNDWLFVTPKDSKGWILDAICREIGGRHRGTWEVVYNPKVLPEARNYFFAHYWNYLDHIKKNPHVLNGNCLVWYTHPREIPYSTSEQVEGFNKSKKVIFTCSEYRDLWVGRGVRSDKAVVILGGADPHLFSGHVDRNHNMVGLSASFYERKNPDALLDVVSSMNWRNFTLVGRRWENYEKFSELKALPNFNYVEAPYEDYPKIYRGFDVFLSMAMLEGGPIPLVEAMMENVMPVASRTGFAPDLIDHGVNGYLFPVGAGANIVVPLVEEAFSNDADVRRTVLPYSWDKFALAVHALCDASNGPVTSARAARPETRLSEIDSAPSPADVELMRRVSRIDREARGGSVDRLASSLSKWAPEASAGLVVILTAASLRELDATPAVAQLAEVACVDLDLIIAAGSVDVAQLMVRDLRFSPLDGLIEVSSANENSCLAELDEHAAVLLIQAGSSFCPEDMSSVVELIDAGNPGDYRLGDEGGARLVIGVRPAPRRVAVPDIRTITPRFSVGVEGGRVLRIGSGGPAASRVVLRRAAYRNVRDIAAPTPLQFVRNDPVRLHWDGGGGEVDSPRLRGNLCPDMVRAYLNRGGAGNPVVAAFADAIGADLAYAEDQEEGDALGVSVVWGVLRGSDKVIERSRRDGRPFYYIDHAYFGRGHGNNYRISRDSYEAGPIRDCPPDRLMSLNIDLRPWRSGGGAILVCPPTQYFCDAHGCPNWLQDTVTALRRATDRPIEVRKKPAAGEPVEPLHSAFSRAWAVVAHSSNVAVEAVVAGVPVFVAPSSAAAPMGEVDLSRIELPRRPEREAWLAHLAYSQFSLAEIRSGSAWRTLLDNEMREFLR